MDSDLIWRHVVEQRARLADLFDTIDAHRWQTPSLCDGWTVRDVAAHLTHSHMSKPRMVREAVQSGFRFNAMVHRVAVQDNRTPRQIAEDLRGMKGSHRLWGMRFPLNPQRRLRGVALVATDANFSVGHGRRVEAPTRNLLMRLAGRPAGITTLR